MRVPADERKRKGGEIPGDHGQPTTVTTMATPPKSARRTTVPAIVARLGDETAPDSNGATDGDERSRDREGEDVPGCDGQRTKVSREGYGVFSCGRTLSA